MRLSNGRVEVGVGREHGELACLADVHSGQNFAGAGASGAGLWEMTLGPTRRVLSPADAQSFRCQPLGGKQPGLRLTWEGFGVAAAPELRVEAVVRLERGPPVSRWEMAVNGLRELSIGQVRFPRVVNIPQQENERLAVPVWMGQQTAEPRKVFAGENRGGRRQEWAYPGILSMQCLAFYRQDGPGLYLACDDSAGFSKTFAFFGDAKGGLAAKWCTLLVSAECARPRAQRAPTRAARWKTPRPHGLRTLLRPRTGALRRIRTR